MTLRSIHSLAALATLVATLSCSGDGIAPPTSTQQIAPSPDSTLRAGLIVSGPIARSFDPLDHSGSSASVAMLADVSCVSLVPGTVPDGVTATITSLRSAQRITTPIVDGGFDPQQITAGLDDSLEIRVSRGGKPDAAVFLRVGPRIAPRIVRTRPPRGQTDAPLNTVITIVFSEPVDPASVSATSVALSTGGSPVAADVRVPPGLGYIVELSPNALLAPNAVYSFTVSGVRDLAGTPLDAPVSITFATGGSESAGFVALVTISPDTATVKAGARIKLTVTQTDAVGQPVSTADRPVTWTSNAPDVASVNWQGEVVGIGPGTAMITARGSADGPTATAQVTVEQTTAPVGAIVTALCHDNAGGCGIYAVDPDGTNGRLLTGNLSDADPVWSPDGKSIAFRSQRNCGGTRLGCFSNLYIMKGDGSGIGADGSGLRSLTVGSGLEVGGISWSPDGSRLVFAAGPFPPSWDIGDDLYVVNADGSDLRRLLSAPTNGSLSSPDWSPDGGRIVYSVTAPGDTSAIDVVNTDGSNVVRLSTPPGNNRDVKPRWSPDGKRIAFTRWSFTPNDRPSTASQALVMNADGSIGAPFPPENLWEWYPAWSPDGSSLAVFSRFYDGLFLASADGAGDAPTTILCCGFDVYSSLSWRRAPAAVPLATTSRARP